MARNPNFGLSLHFILTNFIAQRTKISPKILIWAMKLPTWPPYFYSPPLLFPRFVYVAFLVLLAGHLAGIAACLVEKALAPTLSLDQRTKATGC